MSRSWHEECGVFGVYAPGEDVSRITFFGLHALQHRGQESAGIATTDGKLIHIHTGMGLVSQVFREEHLRRLPGKIAIGHNRYSTSGASKPGNAQPIKGQRRPASEGIALAHNGNLVNTQELRRRLKKPHHFPVETDSQLMALLLCTSPGRDWIERVRHTIPEFRGSYSLVLLTRDSLMGIRDPYGVRPLCLGRLRGGWVLASESCALDHIGSQFVREVEPGELVCIDSRGVTSLMIAQPAKGGRALCMFEFIYFARPDSIINGQLLYPVRQAMGAQLAVEHPVAADLVIGVPDSATAAGIGYAQASGIPFVEGLLKNRYVGRTFIEPDQRIRELGVQLKFNALPEILKGKRVVVVDDSIVRGTTTPRIVALLRRAGAREVHMRVCAPPIRYPCFYGVDMATQGELIAAHKSTPEIATIIGANTLGYLNLDGLIHAVGLPRNIFCLACFTGDYPIPSQPEMERELTAVPRGDREGISIL
ncbi:MAG: amidophosphoribosyltransferase [Chloroflexi bacterium]|nr:amidophosphoribosyltransferase [Chloroflexota bacterium]